VRIWALLHFQVTFFNNIVLDFVPEFSKINKFMELFEKRLDEAS
jgi:hypothetical protein